MVYFQIDLSSSSKEVREAFKKFPYIEVEGMGEVIIIQTESLADVQVMLKALTFEAVTKDMTLTYPVEMQAMLHSMIVNNKPLDVQFGGAKGCTFRLKLNVPTVDIVR